MDFDEFEAFELDEYWDLDSEGKERALDRLLSITGMGVVEYEPKPGVFTYIVESQDRTRLAYYPTKQEAKDGLHLLVLLFVMSAQAVLTASDIGIEDDVVTTDWGLGEKGQG